MATFPPAVTSAGPEAVELAASAGLILDPWQCYAVEVILAERADGCWAAFETAILVARQNGKGGILEALELAGLFLLGEQLIVHSAHEFKTAQEAFRRFRTLIDGCDDLRRRVARVRTSHGDEAIELLTGQRLRYVARSRSSGLGFTADRMILDEAQQLPRLAMGALLPTLSARPNPQVNYAGTVPVSKDDSEHFESVRDRGRRGADPTLAWLEWSPKPTGPDHNYDGVDLDDPTNQADANPALGYRIPAEAISRERASLGVNGANEFAGQRLSIWPGATTSAPATINLDRWRSLAGKEDHRPSPVAFAVAVSPDRKWGTVGVAGVRADGAQQVQIVETGKGTLWMPERVEQLTRQWQPVTTAGDPSSPAGSLLTDLRQRGVPVTELTGRGVAQACGDLLERIDAGTIFHAGQQVLDVAAGAATRRSRGDLWEWASRDPEVDVSPLQAVTYALAALTAAPPPKRTGKVW